MNSRLKKLILIVIVISSVLIVGGVVYTSILGAESNQYSKTMGTISVIETEEKGENIVVVKEASVTYETPQGTKTNKLTGVLPSRLEEGSDLEIRYNKANPDVVTAEMIDWFPAVFLLILGVLYAVGGGLVVILRKKAGYYAIVEQSNDPTPLEEDDFSILDQLGMIAEEEASSDGESNK